MTRAVAALMAAALAFGGPRAVRAGDAELAEASFQQGHVLLAEKRYAEACALFAESARLDAASGTLLALAYCQELSGRLASAWKAYLGAAEVALKEGHAERKGAALERSQALHERLSMLTLLVPAELSALPDLRLLRDGVEVQRSEYGAAVPVDGGSHRIEASAPGRAPWSETVTLQNEGDRKTLMVPVLAPASTTPTAAAPSTAPAPAPAPPRPDVPDDTGSHQGFEQISLALALGSITALGVGTAFGFAAHTKNNASYADGHCDSRGCDERGTELRNEALSNARVATWCFVAGGALAVGSVVLYFGTRRTSPARVEVSAQGATPRVRVGVSF